MLNKNKENAGKEEENYFVGCTNTQYLCIYGGKFKENDRIAIFPVIDTYITCITASSKLKCIFMGTNKGKIRISLWPLND